MPACFLFTILIIDHDDIYDDDHGDLDDDGILVDAGMLSGHSGESHRVCL